MDTITAKYLFEIFCERFAALGEGIKSFPATLIIEFSGPEIIFYHEEPEWSLMSKTSIEDYFAENDDYDYFYEQDAIIVKNTFNHDLIDFEKLKKQFIDLQDETGFAHVASIPGAQDENSHIIALTHFKELILDTPGDYEYLIFQHTLNVISNTYLQYQKPVFAKIRPEKRVDTLIIRWWESAISYNLHYGENTKISFERTLYVEDDVEIMLQDSEEDSDTFFAIWLILYRVCFKLKESLANHPMFSMDFKCYPAFFDHSDYKEEYSNFALHHKNMDSEEYIKLAIKELKKPAYF